MAPPSRQVNSNFGNVSQGREMLDLMVKSTDDEYSNGRSMMEAAFANGNMSLKSDITMKEEGLDINGGRTSKRARSSCLPGGSIINPSTIILSTVGIDGPNHAVLAVINSRVLAAATDTHSIPTFYCQSDLRNPGQKSLFFGVKSDQIEHNIMPQLRKHGGRIEQMLPPPLRGELDLEKSTISNGNIDFFCRIICCPHHNKQCQSFAGGLESHEQAHIHGNTFHASCFCTLLSVALTAIGWYCCIVEPKGL